jgi:hypothetical protein
MTVAAMADRVRDVLHIKGAECPMEALVALCADLTWKQVLWRLIT